VAGANKSVKAVIGATGKMLDFSSGIFNLGNTFGTLFGFVSGGNGVGKGEQYTFTNCTLLAEDVINFTAAAAACDAELKWTLVNTDNLAYTEIQQSTDGVNFATINKVSPSAAYKVTVAQQSKVAYYRLKVYDRSNSFHISNIASVKTVCGNAIDKLTVIPTLINATATIVYTTSVNKGTVMVQVQDVYGRTLKNELMNVAVGINKLTINTNSLPAAVYYITLKGKGWNSETIKVIKQ
jgi:hypothetical protein